jgi:RNA polymerase sigma-70 factor (ECF subfamily)
MSQPYSISDDELIKKYTTGDVKAFEELVERYKKPIVNFIYRMIGDFQEAEDIAQEVFIKLYWSAHTYEGRSSFVTWLFKIASNLCCDNLRAKSHWECISLESVKGQLLEDSIFPSPQTSAENSELARYIEVAIGKLSVQQRQAIVLREYYNLSYTEIAEIEECSVTTIKSRIYKAKQQLKRRLNFLLE